MLGSLDLDLVLISLDGLLFGSGHSCATKLNRNWKLLCLIIPLSSGHLYVVMPVSFTKRVSSSRWKADIDPEGLNLQSPSIVISSPASASVGCYRFRVYVFTQKTWKTCAFGKFTLLCNPWCPGEFKSTTAWLMEFMMMYRIRLSPLTTWSVPFMGMYFFHVGTLGCTKYKVYWLQRTQCLFPSRTRERSTSRMTLGCCLWGQRWTLCQDHGPLIR